MYLIENGYVIERSLILKIESNNCWYLVGTKINRIFSMVKNFRAGTIRFTLIRRISNLKKWLYEIFLNRLAAIRLSWDNSIAWKEEQRSNRYRKFSQISDDRILAQCSKFSRRSEKFYEICNSNTVPIGKVSSIV